jgi:hypothetical protein
VISLLGTYQKECKTGYNRATCTHMFIAALFIIAKLWKQPRGHTTDEWIQKVWYTPLCNEALFSHKEE